MKLRRRTGVCILAVILLGLTAVQGAAQAVDDSLLGLLKDLPAAEREKLLREYGLPPGGEYADPGRDVSTPQVVVPREQLHGDRGIPIGHNKNLIPLESLIIS